MAEYAIKIVDAFTTEPFAGNPSGVVTRAQGLTGPQMQAIARELNLSETAFVTPSDVAAFRVLFFTPRAQIPLAGHPTIATMHVLAEEGAIDFAGDTARITQELNAGVLPVDLRREDNGRVRITMTQATPSFGPVVSVAETAAALGLATVDLLAAARPQVVSTGTPQLMVAVRGIEILRRVRPDASRLATLESAHGFIGTHVFTLETMDPANRAHSRHFAPNFGIPEDPVTGSATGGMAAYCWRLGLLRERRYTVEQGHIIGRPGIVGVEVDPDGDIPSTVRVSGTAVTVLRGLIQV